MLRSTADLGNSPTPIPRLPPFNLPRSKLLSRLAGTIHHKQNLQYSEYSSMLRQVFAAAPSARLVSPISSAAFKTQISHPPTWRLLVRFHVQSCLKCVRTKKSNTCAPQNPTQSSCIPRQLTTSATLKYSSPFRLSTDKHATPFNFPEDDPYSQYPPKRQWPPDMSKLSPKHQFRLERKYRRRAALKYARPKFIKMVTLAQWIIIGCMLCVNGDLDQYGH